MGAFVAGVLTVLAGRIFVLKEVVIEGPPEIGREQVMAWAGLRGGENLIWLDLQDVVKELEGQQWIVDVRLWKVWPNTLRVRLALRETFAYLDVAGGTFAVDREGVILEGAHEAAGSLPMVRGVRIGSDRRVANPEWPSVVLAVDELGRILVDSGIRTTDVEIHGGDLTLKTDAFELMIALEDARGGLEHFETLAHTYGMDRIRRFAKLNLTVPQRIYATWAPVVNIRN